LNTSFTGLPKHGYRCIGIDLRGFGDFDRPSDEFATELQTYIIIYNPVDRKQTERERKSSS
jgi:pimeloyl-ACP methyl ester carboxylesterase